MKGNETNHFDIIQEDSENNVFHFSYFYAVKTGESEV